MKLGLVKTFRIRKSVAKTGMVLTRSSFNGNFPVALPAYDLLGNRITYSRNFATRVTLENDPWGKLFR